MSAVLALCGASLARIRAPLDAISARVAAASDRTWIVFLTVLGLGIYLPRLTSYPLWDPWEPHYTQVAWEMEERNTWVNPWYRGLDNWWSKPIFMLWMLRASLGLLWDPIEHFADNLLAARLPFALFAVLGGLLHYLWVSRLFGRAVGALASVILITAPQYVLLGRQVIVDIPFLATYAASMGLLAVGWFTPRPPLAPFDAPFAQRCVWAWRREWPFIGFWSLQAISMLAKGYVPTSLAVLVVAGYWACTFRWRDYAALTAGRRWGRYVLVRGGAALLGGALLGGIFWASARPELRGSWGAVLKQPAGVWIALTWLFAHAWWWTGLYAARAPAYRRRLLAPLVGAGLTSTALYVLAHALADAAPLWAVGMGVGMIALAPIGILLGSATIEGGTAPRRGVSGVRFGLATGGAGLAMMCAFAAAFSPVSSSPAAERELGFLRLLLVGFGAAALIAACFHDLPPVRHAWRVLGRMRAAWGIPLFLAIGAPWFVYMSFAHGWPYWNEWVFYHHLGRAAGTIDKPSNTFDYYVRQLAVAFFPWSGFTVAALWRFLPGCNPLRSVAGRRNTYVLLCGALPYLFFTLSGTKFAHYIFPVVPFLTVIVAAALVSLGKRPPERVELEESEPEVGAPVPDYAAPPQTWWQWPAARGTLLIFATLALIGFGIVAHDLVIDFRLILRLFIYYYNRATPHEFQPFLALQAIFVPIGLVIGLLLVSRWVSGWHLAGVAAGSVVFACYIAWVMLPAMGDTFSYAPFYGAYQQMAKPGEDIGQYNDWQQPERSVIFLFKNRCKHLRNDQQAEAFLKRSGRKFIIVDRDRLPALRRVARAAGKTLYVVFDGHPYARMVSDEPAEADARAAAEHILTELPPEAQIFGRDGANFGDKIRLIATQVEPAEVKPGQSARVSFYYRCESLIDEDWQIFIHGDGPQGGSNRLHLDHFPVDGMYPTTEWQKGEIIRDTFEVPVPVNYPFDYFVLWTGWYRGETRLDLVGDAPSDGNHRLRGPVVRVAK